MLEAWLLTELNIELGEVRYIWKNEFRRSATNEARRFSRVPPVSDMMLMRWRDVLCLIIEMICSKVIAPRQIIK